jgi:hypothetical protein
VCLDPRGCVPGPEGVCAWTRGSVCLDPRLSFRKIGMVMNLGHVQAADNILYCFKSF